MTFNYYTYKNDNFSCPKCNWNGLGLETFLSDFSEIHTLRDIECPRCESTLYTFDLAKVESPSQNSSTEDNLCLNCKNKIIIDGNVEDKVCILIEENQIPLYNDLKVLKSQLKEYEDRIPCNNLGKWGRTVAIGHYTNKINTLESELGMIEGCQMKRNFKGF
jgi:hypothetical protein